MGVQNVEMLQSSDLLCYLEPCKKYIFKQGFDFKSHLVYIIRKENRYYLKVGYYSLGYISETDTKEPEVRFLSLINKIRATEGMFDCFIFPCQLKDWKYSGECIIIRRLKEPELKCSYHIYASTGLFSMSLQNLQECPGHIEAIVRINVNKPSFELSDVQVLKLINDLNESPYVYGTWSMHKKSKQSFTLQNIDWSGNKQYVTVANTSKIGIWGGLDGYN